LARLNGLEKSESIKNIFIVPNYYKQFSCKGTDCRNTCCSGWKVTIPMNQYFSLHGLECNKSLRDKIDRAFRPLQTPTKERYAEITHNQNGDCPLLLKSGYCELHSKFGEEVLPSVCRYYPRGPKMDYALESSCTNSCEKTLELLFENDDPITFEKRELSFKMPLKSNGVSSEDKILYHSVRIYCFRILADRTHSLIERILKIGKVLSALDIDKSIDLNSIDLSIPRYHQDILKSYRALNSASDWFVENSPNISEICKDSILYFSLGDLEENYKSAVQHFNGAFPNHEVYFEKMLINSLFFRQFPFQDFSANFYEEFISLCGMYSFTRYLSLATMRDKSSIEEFIDLMTKAYRVISHTRFERTILVLLKAEGIYELDEFGILLQA